MKKFSFSQLTLKQQYGFAITGLSMAALVCFWTLDKIPPKKEILSYPLSRTVFLSNGATVDSVNALESTILENGEVMVSVQYATTVDGVTRNLTIYDRGDAKPYQSDFDTVDR